MTAKEATIQQPVSTAIIVSGVFYAVLIEVGV
jgi:hypothetical protein